MTRYPFETLSAFLDGEPVEPAVLADALTVPGAREALRDFALLRAELLTDESRPGTGFYERMDGLLAVPARRKPWWFAAVPVPVPAYALALGAVIVIALGGWTWRSTARLGPAASEMPPPPDHVVVFQPGVDWK